MQLALYVEPPIVCGLVCTRWGVVLLILGSIVSGRV